MVKFEALQDADMEARGGNYFEVGVYQVIIEKAETGKTDSGKEYVEFTLLGEDDQEGSSRLWFTTEKASKYAMSIMAGIAVHNTPEAKKDSVRAVFKGITDTDVVTSKWLEKFAKMEAWVNVYEDTNGAQKPNGGYYKRIEITGYEPRPKATQQMLDASTPITSDDIPFGE